MRLRRASAISVLSLLAWAAASAECAWVFLAGSGRCANPRKFGESSRQRSVVQAVTRSPAARRLRDAPAQDRGASTNGRVRALTK